MKLFVPSLIAAAALASFASAQVTVTFSYDNSLGTSINDLIDMSLDFTVDAIGDVTLDASTTNADAGVAALVDLWDGAVGSITDTNLWDSTFSVAVSTNGIPDEVNTSGLALRATLDTDDVSLVGHLGVRGRNAGRVDNEGLEELYFTPSGLGAGSVFQIEGFRFADSNNAISSADNQVGGNLVLFDPNSIRQYDLPAHTAPGTAVTDPSVRVGDISTVGDGLFVGDGVPLTFTTSEDEIFQAGAGVAAITFDIVAGTGPVVGDINFDGVRDQGDIDDFVLGWKTDTSGLTQESAVHGGRYQPRWHHRLWRLV